MLLTRTFKNRPIWSNVLVVPNSMNYETNFVATFEAAITFVLVKTSVTRVGKFCHFGKKLHAFGKFLIVYFLFGKILSHFGNFFDIIGLIFSVAHCQMLKNNLTILSHWSSPNLFMALVVEAETSDLYYKTFLEESRGCQ